MSNCEDTPAEDESAPSAEDGDCKYVNPTAEGYLGRYVVSAYSVGVPYGTFPTIEWRQGDDVVGIDAPDAPGIQLVPSDHETAVEMEVLGTVPINLNGVGPSLSVRKTILKNLSGLDSKDEIRVYEYDEGAGLSIVLAEPDPFLANEGSYDDTTSNPDEVPPQSFTVEFETASDVERLQQAVRDSQFGSPAALIRSATKATVQSVLTDAEPDSLAEPTTDSDSDATSSTSDTTNRNSPADCSLWCGCCGWGPGNENAVKAHHGGSPSHQGNPILLSEKPSEEDLEGVDESELPDHRNRELLDDLYQQYNGNISALYRNHEFDVSSAAVRSWLVKFDIHNVTPHDADPDEHPTRPPEQELEQLYNQHDGNMSAMHRSIDLDVPYRTLTNWLRDLEIHEPNHRDYSSQPPSSEPKSSEVAVDSTTEGPASFAEIDTPSWLDEASFFAAVDMADTVSELGEALGWNEPDTLESIVELMELDLRSESA